MSTHIRAYNTTVQNSAELLLRSRPLGNDYYLACISNYYFVGRRLMRNWYSEHTRTIDPARAPVAILQIIGGWEQERPVNLPCGVINAFKPPG